MSRGASRVTESYTLTPRIRLAAAATEPFEEVGRVTTRLRTTKVHSGWKWTALYLKSRRIRQLSAPPYATVLPLLSADPIVNLAALRAPLTFTRTRSQHASRTLTKSGTSLSCPSENICSSASSQKAALPPSPADLRAPSPSVNWYVHISALGPALRPVDKFALSFRWSRQLVSRRFATRITLCKFPDTTATFASQSLRQMPMPCRTQHESPPSLRWQPGLRELLVYVHDLPKADP